jgi:hypothetical protein
MIYPTLVVDGRVAGVWTLHRSAQRVTVRVFGSLRAAERRALAAEVDDLARFLDCPVRLDSVGEF